MNIINNKKFWLILIIISLLTTGFSITNELSFYGLIGLLILILVLLFIKYPIIGIYVMAFLYPFNYFEFTYGSINIPYVDIVGIILFTAWVLKSIFLHLKNKEKLNKNNFPAWFLMSIFVLVSALSLINVEREFFMFSLKYIFRPIIFFYLIYVILPFNIIDSFKKLYNTFKIMFGLGMVLSVMGIISLFLQPIEGLRRAVPIAILGLYPLGTNHNLLAEVFIGLIPIAFILYWQTKDHFWKSVYLLGALLMIGVNLLTLSRAGWLVLIIELLIIAGLKYRKEFKNFLTSYVLYLIIFLLTPALYLMYKLLTSTVMLSASLSRLKLIEISFILLKENYLLGSGVGMFTNILWDIKWYIIEYGGVVDAHGFVFKTMAESGILGTVSFIALLTYISYILYKGYNKSKHTPYSWLILGSLIMVIGGIAFQFFGTGYYLAKLWLPIGLALTSLKLTKLYFVKN